MRFVKDKKKMNEQYIYRIQTFPLNFVFGYDCKYLLLSMLVKKNDILK